MAQGVIAQQRRAIWLSAALTAGFLVLLWSSLAAWTMQNRSETLNQLHGDLDRALAGVEGQLQRIEQVAELMLLAAAQWFAAHPDSDPYAEPGFADSIERLRKAGGHLLDLRLIKSDGALYQVPDLSGSRVSVADRDYFKAQSDPLTRGLFIGNALKSRVTGLWGIPISAPLPPNKAGFSVGLVVLEHRALEPLLKAQLLSAQASVSVYLPDGRLLARVPQNEKDLGQSFARGPVFQEGLPAARRGFLMARSSIDGVERIGAYAVATPSGLVVAVTDSEDSALVGWRRESLRAAAAGAVLSLLALIVLWRVILLLRAAESRAETLHELASVDTLTGRMTRRMVLVALSREFARATRSGAGLSVLALDIDHFKRVNDTYGHAAGDTVLRAFSHSISAGLRHHDSAGRLGGEEFLVLLPEANEAEAVLVAERMRAEIEELPIQVEGRPIPITTSVGIATLGAADTSPEQLLERADAALYEAKRSGRNRVASRGIGGQEDAKPALQKTG